MRKLLKCELLKIRHRHLFLTALAVTAVACVWAFYGDYSTEKDSGAFMIANGWAMFLYQLPLVNSIFFPLLSTVTASRICDPEHKGNNLKLLCTLTGKGWLYDAKLLFGLAVTLLCVTLFWIATLCVGCLAGFAGTPPLIPYLLYLLFTLVPTASVYCFQHALSMCFRNQAVPFFVGILGQFVGLFSLFLPQFPLLRKGLIWGHYGALQFMGFFGWTRETRYRYAYVEHMGYDWGAFVLCSVFLIVLYLAGRTIFCKKEV